MLRTMGLGSPGTINDVMDRGDQRPDIHPSSIPCKTPRVDRSGKSYLKIAGQLPLS